MKYRLVFCLFVSLLLSCNSNTIYEKPKDLIPKDSMVLLLTDMYIAISARNVKNKYRKKEKNYMPFVYEKYGIDSVRFYASSNYYTSKIEPYHEILNEVKSNIKTDLDSIEKVLEVQDSIKKAKREERKKAREKRDSIAKIKKDSIEALKKKF